jgi:flagellar biosynthesis protein FlhF
MKIKRYEGPEIDLPRLILQVKHDLGDNAIIKKQTYKKGGLFGIGGERWVRILAGVEEKPSTNGEDRTSSGDKKMNFDPPRRFTNEELKPEVPQAVSIDDSPAIKAIMQELKTLRYAVDDIKRKEEQKETEKEKEKEEAINILDKPLPGWFEYLRKLLEKNGMSRETARSLAEGVIEITPAAERDDFDQIKERFVEYMVSLIVKKRDSDSDETGKKRVIILIGPTGVGKTTTLAKLAANFALLEEKSVSLITADTYRIAAIDQLRTFAQIINLPLDVIFSPFELKKAVNAQVDKDVVLVDTAGRSPLDEEKMTELAELLKEEIGAEVHLVLSATTKTVDLKAISDRFKSAGYDYIILSKIDETVSYGPLIEFLLDEEIPLSYLTNGQNVPDDIIFATERDLIELIAKRALEGAK